MSGETNFFVAKGVERAFRSLVVVRSWSSEVDSSRRARTGRIRWMSISATSGGYLCSILLSADFRGRVERQDVPSVAHVERKGHGPAKGVLETIAAFPGETQRRSAQEDDRCLSQRRGGLRPRLPSGVRVPVGICRHDSRQRLGLCREWQEANLATSSCPTDGCLLRRSRRTPRP
jgi:hypothetical protein